MNAVKGLGKNLKMRNYDKFKRVHKTIYIFGSFDRVDYVYDSFNNYYNARRKYRL